MCKKSLGGRPARRAVPQSLNASPPARHRQRSRYMSVRHLATRVAASLAATAAVGAFALAFAVPTATPAGASTACTNSGDQCLSAAQPQGTVTPGPFSSGQNINVVIPANDTFSSTDGLNNNHSNINILECSAPNGVIPTTPSACDGNTISANTILPAGDGSFTFDNYPVYALPDSVTFGEGSTGPQCGDTAATECILYIGNNQNDFTQPPLWSQPFLILANGTDSGANPGDGTPEVPLAIILPVAAMGLIGGTVLIRRRRATRAPAS